LPKIKEGWFDGIPTEPMVDDLFPRFFIHPLVASASVLTLEAERMAPAGQDPCKPIATTPLATANILGRLLGDQSG
jgi:hypothetical protein